MFKLEDFDFIEAAKKSNPRTKIRQVWQWLRQRKLANRCFENDEDIVEQCSKAWNSFMSDIKLVKNLCARKWATTIGS